MQYATTDVLSSSSLWLKHQDLSFSSAIEVGSRSVDVIEASKSVVLWDWVPMLVTTFTDIEALLSLQAWTCMLLSILSYWRCGQVVYIIMIVASSYSRSWVLPWLCFVYSCSLERVQKDIGCHWVLNSVILVHAMAQKLSAWYCLLVLTTCSLLILKYS